MRVFVLGSHRSRLDIVAEMLYAIREKAKKTQIMYRSNLSYALLMKYLNELNSSYLARFEPNESRYVLTEKGLDFLSRYEDYLKRNKYVEKRISDINDRRRALEDLCGNNHGALDS